MSLTDISSPDLCLSDYFGNVPVRELVAAPKTCPGGCTFGTLRANKVILDEFGAGSRVTRSKILSAKGFEL